MLAKEKARKKAYQRANAKPVDVPSIFDEISEDPEFTEALRPAGLNGGDANPGTLLLAY